MTDNKKWNNQKKAAVGEVGGRDKTQRVIKVSQKNWRPSTHCVLSVL